MDELDLYRYALFSCLFGFFLLGFVVLFVPLSYDDLTTKYIDGVVSRVNPSSKGNIVSISLIGEKSLFLPLKANISVGSSYRFYEPKGDELLFISDFRLLS